MPNKLIDTIKANRKTIIRRTVILAAVATTVVVVGALFKNGTFSGEVLEVPVVES